MKNIMFFQRHQRNLTVSLLLFFSLISCNKEINIENNISEKNGSISRYVQEIKNSNIENEKELTLFENSLLLHTSKIYDQNNNEKLQIIDLESTINTIPKAEKPKAAFFLKDNRIINAVIVTFTKSTDDDNKTISDIFNNSFKANEYSGRISLYDIAGRILLFNEASNGKIVLSGFAKPKTTVNPRVVQARPASCIDWYFVTYYGGAIINETYLYTTCGGCPDQNSISPRFRLNCGGGGGGGTPGSGPNPPPNPIDGATYSHTDRDGTRRDYIAYGNVWRFVAITLSPVTVNNNQSTYPNLVSDSPPENGTQVDGNDTFLYTYNAWAGTWNGGPAYDEFGTGVLELFGGTGPYDGPNLEDLASGPAPGVRWGPVRTDYPQGPLGNLLFKLAQALYVNSLFPGVGALRAPASALRAGNFRTNLELIVSKPNQSQIFDAHHILPQKFANWFESKGINIHDPKFGTWWEQSAHRSSAYNYNRAWSDFIDQNPNASFDEIWNFGRSLTESHNVPVIQN